MKSRVLRSVLGVLALALSACGSPSPAGNWTSTTQVGTSSTTVVTLSLVASGSFTMKTVVTMTGDCVQTIALAGSWTSDGTTITITPASGTDTTTSCIDPTQNMSGAATSGDLAVVTGPYTLTATTLFIQGDTTYNFNKS